MSLKARSSHVATFVWSQNDNEQLSGYVWRENKLEVLEDWEAKFEEKYVKVSQLGSEKASTTVVDEKLLEDQTKEE
ncbi:hypothetical protein Tco_1199415 [Tanacetum coccineum]